MANLNVVKQLEKQYTKWFNLYMSTGKKEHRDKFRAIKFTLTEIDKGGK